MVSFSCENCGDVLTKKKLDSHRGQCHGASYTCLDCHVHFQGTSYRAHTSCITEDQKYQGALYKPKSKQNLRGQKENMSQAMVPRKAYVESTEDLPSTAVAIVDAPPKAPSPPPATDVNVFDFLVPNHSQATLAQDEDASKALPSPDDSGLMERDGEKDKDVWYDVEEPVNDPMQYEHCQERRPREYVHHYEDPLMYEYGTDPVAPEFDRYDSYTQFPAERPDPAYFTPAPRKDVSARGHGLEREESSTAKKSAKRKRGSPDHINVSATKALQPHINSNGDIVMSDAPAALHSGLTGGLNRLMSSRHGFPPSPDVSGEGEGLDGSPLSPLKKAKHSSKEDRGRDAKLKAVLKRKAPTSRVHVGFSSGVRREEKTSPPREREDSREHRRRRRRHRSRSPDEHDERRDTKAIEYNTGERRSSNSGALIKRDAPGALAVRTEVSAHMRAELFMSFITKGPESERGYSINKALKRYHRERFGDDEDEDGEGEGERGGRNRKRSKHRDEKTEEEKELWKSLRLRRNERGEIVLFF